VSGRTLGGLAGRSPPVNPHPSMVPICSRRFSPASPGPTPSTSRFDPGGGVLGVLDEWTATKPTP
jgi:hypothetical protein